MIVNSMTDKEICNEINKEVKDITKNVCYPYFRKNRSILKNNGIKNKTIMVDKTFTTKRNNVVRLIILKERSLTDEFEFSYCFLFRSTLPNGKYIYYKSITDGTVTRITSHFTDRLLERAGLTMKEFQRRHIIEDDNTTLTDEIEYKGKLTHCCQVLNGLAIYEENEYCTDWITWISKDMLSSEQLAFMEDNAKRKREITEFRYSA